VRVPENFFGCRPDQHFFPSRFTAPAKYDQIDVIGFRAVYDLLHWVSNRNRSFKFDFQIFGTLGNFLELFFKMLTRVIEHGIDFNHRCGLGWTGDGKEKHFRV